MFPRTITETLLKLRKQYPVITLTGPRQSGKTTICRSVFKDLPYINFERPDLRDRYEQDPLSYFADFPTGAILDEFQRIPSVASYVQSIVDEPDFRGTFVLTGSTNLVVRDTVDQSLAGRSAILELLPLSQSELGRGGFDPDTDSLLYSGGYPRIYDRSIEPTRLLSDYVATYVERDIRRLAMVRDLTRFQTFLGLCAGRTGSILNLEQLGNEAGVSQPTAREWISLLEASYIVFRLPPYHANISKRLVKRPKLYFYDAGIASYLLGINDAAQLRNHPLRGALFETLIVSEIIKAQVHRGKRAPVSFYRDAKGNEVDLILSWGTIDVPIEIKSTRTYAAELTKGIDRFRKVVPERAENAPAYVIYDGIESFSVSKVNILPRNKLDTVIQQSDRH